MLLMIARTLLVEDRDSTATFHNMVNGASQLESQHLCEIIHSVVFVCRIISHRCLAHVTHVNPKLAREPSRASLSLMFHAL
jgi:hypothetical protein